MNYVSPNHLNVALHVSGGKDVSVFWATGTAPLRCRGSGQGGDYYCFIIIFILIIIIIIIRWTECGPGVGLGPGEGWGSSAGAAECGTGQKCFKTRPFLQTIV